MRFIASLVILLGLAVGWYVMFETSRVGGPQTFAEWRNSVSGRKMTDGLRKDLRTACLAYEIGYTSAQKRETVCDCIITATDAANDDLTFIMVYEKMRKPGRPGDPNDVFELGVRNAALTSTPRDKLKAGAAAADGVFKTCER